MLVHFAAVAAIVCLAKGALGEVVWLSHTGLLVAGLGLALQSTLLTTTALTAVGVLHGLWLVDALPGLSFGWFPLGPTTYLLTADRWTWVATSHHFYLAPTLFVICWRHRVYPRAALLAAALLLLLLTTVARIVLSPAANVNYAFSVTVMASHPLVAWVNELDAFSYLLVVNAFVISVMFLPLVLLMRYRARGIEAGEELSRDDSASCRYRADRSLTSL